MFSPSFLTLIHHHHHPKTFHVLGCNHHVFSIISHTNPPSSSPKNIPCFRV
ncbi:hypothetical protein RchiOBHm_Chr1g0365961 [Rosa chinensis]|uniref:Uncharacterized protein n=1 Tax=Rosa chinensis TaxID=74649 RepID=A0A2P6SK45_ROSCH|nr:hypothetical protein RchiOBHm_Chr1g0365961 [Rosa chinensis]